MGFFTFNEQFTERRNERTGDPFNRSFNSVIYLVSGLFLIGCKEVARCLSEVEGVSEAETKVIAAILEIEK